MSVNEAPRPATVGGDDVKDAGALLGAAVGAAVPASVAVGVALEWLRLHDAGIDPLPVLSRVPKDELALDGAQVLVYVVASTLFAFTVVILADLFEMRRTPAAVIVLAGAGIALILVAVPLQAGADLGLIDFREDRGGTFLVEEPARWAAVAGGGLVLSAVLAARSHRWNDWRYAAASGGIYALIATAAVFLYLAVTHRGTERDSLGPPAIVLLANPRPEAKGMPRRRLEGRLVWANADGVGLCVLCEPTDPYRRVVEFPRRRIVWVRVQTADSPPLARQLKPFG